MTDYRDDNMRGERARIIQAYENREERRSSQSNMYFGYQDGTHLIRIQERHRHTLRLLRRNGVDDFESMRVVDVGCGKGHFLGQLLQWNALPENLSGIDLREHVIQDAKTRYSDIDLRTGCATELPWADSEFDIACAFTVLSSILDQNARREVATEIKRVVRPGGFILCYDFVFDNPANPDVCKVTRKDIGDIFGNVLISGRRLTLAPPLARAIPESFFSVAYPLFSSIPFLCTHYLWVIREIDSDSG